MTPKTIALMRLAQQRLTGDPLPGPAAVVSWLGAVQAQEYLDTLWSLRLRMAGATLAEVEQAFNDGAILRTHAMRPTWHFVAPADIRWLQALTGPRVHQQNGAIYRRLELDGALLARTGDILTRALAGGRYRTRQELRADLAAAGIEAEGQRLAYIVIHAELEAIICSGPRRGKQFTYALLVERAPNARPLARDEALAELTLRFFTGHGPATTRDMAWWSGLTLGEVREGLELMGGALACERFDGQRYWYSTAQPPTALANGDALLLPTYDEFMIGYTAANRARIGGVEASDEILFYATIVLGGQIVGTWRRTFQKGTVRVELAPFRPLSSDEETAIVAAAEGFAAFVEMPLELEWH
jgi:hypothetical protein